jgi:alkylation response protein AidB-like acyl-CoA dehydrogenase
MDAFRAEVRAWLERHLEPGLVGLNVMSLARGDARLDALRAWNRKVADAGYAAIYWPAEYGGRGAGPMERLIQAEEMSRLGAPMPLNAIGLPNIAPAIMRYGTQAQKDRFLRPMLRGDEIWSQGFSEPDAGSDLASLRTAAVDGGDHFLVDGQKTWNTLGQLADYCEVLVRTDPSAPKHRGITCLLVDMRLSGIEVRPMKNIANESDFSELFFSKVQVPKDALLGPLNEGWKVAMTTLAHERAGVAHLHNSLRQRVNDLFDLARQTNRGSASAAHDPVVRQALGRVYVESELLKLISLRALSGDLHGRAPGAESSLAKLHWTNLVSHIAESAAEILGPAATTGDWAWSRIAARSLSIAGGTTQVNKNLVATRILGLPKGD